MHEFNGMRSELKTDLPQYDVPSGRNLKVKRTGRNDLNLVSLQQKKNKFTKICKCCG
jgi:hypothetical protein